MNLYDDSTFADEEVFNKDLQKQSMDGHYDAAGVVFKCDDTTIYTDPSDKHTLIFGNTGSKKTRNFVIPAIFSMGSANESMIISDPKGEIYESTSGYLVKQGYNIRVLNFRDAEYSNFWNPLALPYLYYTNDEKDRAVEMILDLGNQLSAQVHSSKDVYWEIMATNLFVGLVLMTFEGSSDISNVNFSSILDLRGCIRPQLSDNFHDTYFWRLTDNYKKNNLIYDKLAGIIAIKGVERTLSCVLSTFDAMFKNIFINQKVLYTLSHSQITYEELFSRKTALFLITPDEKNTFHFLISMFIKQSYEFMVSHAYKSRGKLPIRVNYILDEFANLPRISDMPAMISAARSRNIRFTLIVQGMKQLEAIYKEDAETIKSNCHTWIFLSSREIALLREISELCGSVYTQGRGYRPLMSISALQTLEVGWEDSQALILRNNLPPYISWVKDYSYYPQSKMKKLAIDFFKHTTKELPRIYS